MAPVQTDIQSSSLSLSLPISLVLSEPSRSKPSLLSVGQSLARAGGNVSADGRVGVSANEPSLNGSLFCH
jgi:hypothetical protein